LHDSESARSDECTPGAWGGFEFFSAEQTVGGAESGRPKRLRKFTGSLRQETRRRRMKWEDVVREWPKLGPPLKAKWSKLSDDDLAAPGDKRALLVAALARHYGIQEKHAALQLDRWFAALKSIGETAPEPPPGKAM
jgi:hypothetical protein